MNKNKRDDMLQLIKTGRIVSRARASPSLIVLITLVIVLTFSAQAPALSVLVSPGAGLSAGTSRVHPDTNLNLLGSNFNVYTGNSLPSAWVLQASLTSPFHNNYVGGTFYSEVYKHSTEGHTLFRYRISNSGTTDIRSGNIAGFNAGWQILDSGIIDLGGDVSFDQGDVLKLKRPAIGTQLDFAFEATKNQPPDYPTEERLLAVGQTSSWFYMVTDAPSWMIGQATVQDSGSSASPVSVLIPVPEPLTILTVFASIAGLTGYVYRKRRSS